MTPISTRQENGLTERELEIVRLVASGYKNKEVGATLAISERTVKTHLTNIFQKLGVRDRVGLVMYALRHNLTRRRLADTPQPGRTVGRASSRRPSRQRRSPRRSDRCGGRRRHARGSAPPPPAPAGRSGCPAPTEITATRGRDGRHEARRARACGCRGAGPSARPPPASPDRGVHQARSPPRASTSPGEQHARRPVASGEA